MKKETTITIETTEIEETEIITTGIMGEEVNKKQEAKIEKIDDK